MPRRTGRVTGLLATGGVAILALFTLNLAADRLPFEGLKQFRDYTVRRNG